MSMVESAGSTRRVKLRMRERAWDIGDDYWIEDDGGHKVYKIDGKALRVRDTFALVDREGHEVLRIKEKKLGRDRMVIERAGDRVASVKKGLWRLFRPRFVVRVDNGHDMVVKGNIVDHEYDIKRDGDKVAEVSKKWFRVRDTYGIDVAAGADPALIVAVTVCIDQMAHDVG
jgi:uncharacterized protein YxjI